MVDDVVVRACLSKVVVQDEEAEAKAELTRPSSMVFELHNR